MILNILRLILYYLNNFEYIKFFVSKANYIVNKIYRI